jgi:DeoR/GlpR family transcriptional regulator of sugar metabolism
MQIPGIATNSISIASALLDRKNLKVIVLGGEIDRETGAAIGLSAIREAERLSFDLCFLGTCAVSVSLGIGAFQMADAEFKRTLITRSDRTAALVTMDKVETRAPFQVAAPAVLDHVVLESGTSEETVSTFSNAGPKVIIGQPQVASRSTQPRAGIFMTESLYLSRAKLLTRLAFVTAGFGVACWAPLETTRQ